MLPIRKVSLSILSVCSLAIQAAAPAGWYMASSKPADYDTGVDNLTVHNNRASAYLKAKKPAIDGFGTLMQDFKADQYLGKRVRFSAFVKSEEVQNWAGLWMRIDKGTGSANYKMLAFDNMQDRPIKGTTGWQNYEVVLDVAPDATGIYFGILLGGTGTVWLNSATIEIVPPTVPTTGHSHTAPDGPQNLDFQK